MVSFVSYNIDDSSATSAIAYLLHHASATIVSLFEVGWATDTKQVQAFADQAGYPYFETSQSAHTTKHTLILSKCPFHTASSLQHLVNSGIVVDLEDDYGPLRVIALHLASHPESQRVNELTAIRKWVNEWSNVVVMGDLNAIAPGEDATVVSSGDESSPQPVSNEAISLLLEAGLHDIGNESGHAHRATVPFTSDQGVEFANLRLDYFFVSGSVASRIKNYRVLDTPETRQLSDHLPIMLS